MGKAFLMFTDDTDGQLDSSPYYRDIVIDVCVQNGVLPFIWADAYSPGFTVMTSPIVDGGAGGKFFSKPMGTSEEIEEAFFTDLNSIEILVCE